jgi:hypothetical protein
MELGGLFVRTGPVMLYLKKEERRGKCPQKPANL